MSLYDFVGSVPSHVTIYDYDSGETFGTFTAMDIVIMKRELDLLRVANHIIERKLNIKFIEGDENE
jgi:hypothetical protein